MASVFRNTEEKLLIKLLENHSYYNYIWICVWDYCACHNTMKSSSEIIFKNSYYNYKPSFLYSKEEIIKLFWIVNVCK